jgi:DNA-directed RNA polymerase subunit RPC12/RpoP
MAKTYSCWECGELHFKKDIVDERMVYPSRKTQYLCKTCKQKKVDLMIERNRLELGLPKRKETP